MKAKASLQTPPRQLSRQAINQAILLSIGNKITWKSRAIPGLYEVEVPEGEEVLSADERGIG
ncbi:MAG: hypothetical protein ACYTHJ_00575 [Planctomycetota bacterium]|jgi:hypothetical protein